MEETKKHKKTDWLRWVALIWSIPLVVYSFLLVVGNIVNLIQYGKADPYAVEGYPFIENFPPIFILLAVLGLFIAFFYKKIGAIISLGFVALTIIFILIINPNITEISSYIPLFITTIVLVPGALFLMSAVKTKKVK